MQMSWWTTVFEVRNFLLSEKVWGRRTVGSWENNTGTLLSCS